MKPYLVFILVAVCCFEMRAQTFDWKSSSPEEQGFSSVQLNAMRDTLAKYKTTALLVIRNDKVILEWYASGWNAGKKHFTASLAKAIVGGISLTLALQDGLIKVDDPAFKYIPEWKSDPQKSLITIRHLATHSSGIEDAEMSAQDLADANSKGIIIKDRHMDIPGWKGAFWRKSPDPFTISRDEAPVIFTPGTSFHYSNTGMAMLAYAVTASYAGTKYKDIRTLLQNRVFQPIGIPDNEWDIGYGKSYHVGGLSLVPNWGGGSFTARAVARVGRLMLNNGNWNGRQLIDSSWIEQVVKYAGTPIPPRNAKQPALASGLAWYSNFDGIWDQAPRDLYAGSGAGNQTLIVIPSLKMIIVRQGADMFNPDKGEGHFYGVVNYLVNPLMEARFDPPYPKSEFIRDVNFDNPETIIRKACDSDNWPMTWADDDNLYTAYGDGHGFEPATEKKLSLGLAQIAGPAEAFMGVNIRSATGEQYGDGRSGKKASGMLMVDGVLYMWIRNANGRGEESQLAWSSDYGKSWSFSDWHFMEGFGCPGFLNFGKSYDGARDKYVYIYSHDDIDAYKTADQMVMARAPKSRLSDRNAWEFFKELDSKGKPTWTKEISDRGAVFKHPAGCYRNGMSYNKGLKRYIWSQVLPVSEDPRGPRYQGGFGIYEASEPWGPWHTVFFTKNWDVGPGETSSFPPKWMSKDGKTCYLVFSGNDCFSVRRAEFVTK